MKKLDSCGTGEKTARRKRVLIMIPSLGGGGAERVAVRLASEMAERHDVWLMPFSRTAEPYEMSPCVRLVCGADRYDMKERMSALRRLWRRAVTVALGCAHVRKLRKQESIDVTVSMLLGPNVINWLSGRRGRRVMAECSDPAREGSGRKQAVSEFLYRKADLTVFQTEYARDLFSERVRRNSCVLMNPIETDCGVSPVRRKRVATVGRLAPPKNHALLIRAFAMFYINHPEYSLWIYGGGALETELKTLADRLGIGSAVFFPGWSKEPHREIADAEMFVMSSDYEGLPNALLEAMMMGHACVSTACPGVAAVITDGVDGLLVPCGDAAALASAMTRLAEDDVLRAGLGMAALHTAESFSVKRVVPLWEQALLGAELEER